MAINCARALSMHPCPSHHPSPPLPPFPAPSPLLSRPLFFPLFSLSPPPAFVPPRAERGEHGRGWRCCAAGRSPWPWRSTALPPDSSPGAPPPSVTSPPRRCPSPSTAHPMRH
eukprot:1118023-Rhodomonas_salina.1